MSVDFAKMQDIFLSAVEHRGHNDRQAYLDQACAGDEEMRRQVGLLLKAHQEAGSVPGAVADEDLTGTYDNATKTPGTMVGPYKLLELIGEGGMGSVWMAEQIEPVQRRVALKLIKAGMDSRQVITRFEAERQALALMDHPNIAKVLDGGATDEGRPFFVMELVKGTPITKYCDEKKLPVRERLKLFADVCRAVQHAHQKGIIHRDLKPSNVLVAPYDGPAVVKVIDFGVAKATGQKLTEATLFTDFGAVVGTPEYMSPEQAELNNADIDTRSDIYSLGVLVYELLTGTTPLTRQHLKNPALLEVLRVIREEEPPRPSTRLSSTEELLSIAAVRGVEPAKLSRLVRGELDWIVMKSLEKDRTRRYETANGLAADVEHYLNDERVNACPPSVRYRLRKFLRRNRAGLVLTATILAAVTIVGVSATWGLVHGADARAEAASAVAAETEKAGREKQRELLIQKQMQIRLTPHSILWSENCLKLAWDAAQIQRDDALRDQAAAALVGLDGRIDTTFGLPASSLNWDARGRRLLMGGWENQPPPPLGRRKRDADRVACDRPRCGRVSPGRPGGVVWVQGSHDTPTVEYGNRDRTP